MNDSNSNKMGRKYEKLYYDNGSLKYIGETLNGEFYGYGKYYNSDSLIIAEKWEDGDFSDDVGAFFLTVHEGTFKNGNPNGHGKRTTYNYEGEIESNENNDTCKVIGFNSLILHEYVGIWKDGKMVEGKYYYKGKLVDEGKRDGLRLHGFGKKYSFEWFETDIKLYEGGFLDGLYHGDGKIVYKNGNIKYEGDFQYGRKEGYGISYYENGNIKYDGEWKGGFFEGKGKLFYESGVPQYFGYFLKGERNGYGVSCYENKKIEYKGKWKKDKKYGQGEQFDKSGGLKFSGNWINDDFVGNSTFLFSKIKYYRKGILIAIVFILVMILKIYFGDYDEY
jgi:antitoxin component YwqK of YwqJK toxin-antitoxin module